MKLYKLKHIPTGLYYIPSKGRGNLSVNGKTYINQKPSLDWVKSIRIVLNGNPNSKKAKLIKSYFPIGEPNNNNYYWIDKHFKTNESDWEIEKVDYKLRG